jgi:hypothetical protein
MVGRGGTPAVALVLLLTMKNTSPGDHRHGKRLRFSVQREKAKTHGASLGYKFSQPVDLGTNELMFSRRFIGLSTGLHIVSIPDFALPREIIVTRNYRFAKRRSKSIQEATC